MKMLSCVVFIALLCLPLLVFAAPPSPIQAPIQAPKRVQAPLQAPLQAPAQGSLKTAQAGSGYRTYSYEPNTAGVSPGGTQSGSAYIRRGRGHSYENVTNKSAGRVN